MDETWIRILVLLLEVLTMLQCLESVFGRPIRIDRYLILLISMIVTLYGAVNASLIPPFLAFPAYIGILYYTFITFRLPWMQTIVRTIIALAMTGCLEAGAAIVIQIWMGDGSGTLLLLTASLAALAMAGILRNAELGKRAEKRDRTKRMERAAALFYGGIFVLVLADYYIFRRPIRMYAVLTFLLLILLRVYVQGKERTEQVLEQVQGELEQHQKYGEHYEAAMKELRWKLHDYYNQLGAICSMHLVAGTLEQLVGMQRDYVQNLQKQQKYDRILTSCGCRSLAAYLYQSCCLCETQGISVEYHLSLGQDGYDLDLQHVVEVLGILIKNACEYVVGEDRVPNCMILTGKEWNRGVSFTVSNPVCPMDREEIQRMFVYGVSSKGEGRGIGLARIHQLAKEQKLFLKVHQRTEKGGSWLEITVEFPEKQKKIL